MFLYRFLFRVALLGCLGVSLYGCVDIEQEVWVNADGSGRMQYRVGLHEQWLMLQGERNGEEVCRNFYADQQRLREEPGVQSVRHESYREAGVYYCVSEITVQEFTQLGAIHSRAMNNSELESMRGRFVAEFSLKKTDNGLGVFRQHIRNQAGEDGAGLEVQAGQLANALLGRTMSGRYWSMTLHVPEIIESNGLHSPQKEEIQWRVPLYDLMTNPQYAFDMQAKFEPGLAWYRRVWNWITE